MKLITTVLALASAISIAAADAKLSEPLQPLQKLLGNWNTSGTNDKGEKFTGTVLYEVAAEGQAVVGRGKDSDGGSHISTFYFDPEIKKVVAVTIGNDKTVSKNIYPVEDLKKEKFSDLNYFVTAEGKQATALENVEWSGKDQFIWHLSNIIVEGTKLPDSGKVTFKRAK
jgi:hypothetical protein